MHPDDTCIIRLVDDDADLLEALGFMLRSEGWETRSYPTAKTFLESDNVDDPGCVILDYAMPEIDGLQLQEQLGKRNYPHPILFLTAHADVDMAIRAFKRGADDLLRKPIDAQELLAAVANAVEKDRHVDLEKAEREKQLYASLTGRERQVLELVLLGLMNCQVAERLGLSERTVEVHRANGYRKLGVRTIAELGRLRARISSQSK